MVLAEELWTLGEGPAGLEKHRGSQLWMLQPVRGCKRTLSETKRTGGCWGRDEGHPGAPGPRVSRVTALQTPTP